MLRVGLVLRARKVNSPYTIILALKCILKEIHLKSYFGISSTEQEQADSFRGSYDLGVILLRPER